MRGNISLAKEVRSLQAADLGWAHPQHACHAHTDVLLIPKPTVAF